MRVFLGELNAKRLRSYDADPGLLKEHFGIEQTVLAGGYGYRQILELVQNGADAVLEGYQREASPANQNRVHAVLHRRRLYVANTGAPLSEEGLDALLRSHSSPKRGNQIGRFGLGFKSLLKLGGRIDFLTRSNGAIRFDPERCKAELRDRYGQEEVPGLRLAWPVVDEERHADPVCADLAWAETIVRVEIGAENLVEQIRQEIRSFPPEFLLFFPVATCLSLDDGEEPPREVRLDLESEEHVLRDGEAVSRWRIAKREVQIGDAAALADATHIHARKTVPIAWAVPVQGRREEAGRFWAFFPTHTQTYIPGILNAPWKLNSDRNAVIGGEWNTALMAEAAQLIVDALPSLSSDVDPGRPLDAFPRQLERSDDDAAPLVETLWGLLATAAVIPDASGALQPADTLWRHPRDTVTLAAAWQSLAGQEQRRQVVHASCLKRQRASRLNALAEKLESAEDHENSLALHRCTTEAWFGFVASKEPRQALQVFQLADRFAEDCRPPDWNQARPCLTIIPTQSGKLVNAPQAVLAPESLEVPGRATVTNELHADPEAYRILTNILGVKELDNDLWAIMLHEALEVRGYSAEAKEEKWGAFWAMLRHAPDDVRREFVAENAEQIRVRRRDGRWASADHVLLPGGLVDEDDESANLDLLVDGALHAQDEASLLAIGVAAMPAREAVPTNYSDIPSGGVLREWRDANRRQYKQSHNNSATPNYLEPDQFSMPRGYSLLADLTGGAKARLTVHLLDQLTEPAFQRPVGFGHCTVSSYPRIKVPHPLPLYVLNEGAVEIDSVPLPLAVVFARESEPALARLPEWQCLGPAFEQLRSTPPPAGPSTTDLERLWRAAISSLVSKESLADGTLNALWASAARDGVIPPQLPSANGDVPVGTVFVTASIDLARRASTDRLVVVTLDQATIPVWLEAGAQDLSSFVNVGWDGSAGSPERLTDVLPELDAVLSKEWRDESRCQSGIGLRLRIDATTQPVPCIACDGVLLIDGDQLASLSRAERLRLLLAEIAGMGWLEIPPGEALRLLGDSEVDERRAYVAEGKTLPERLMRAVGRRPGPLCEALGDRLCSMDFVVGRRPEELAELVLATLGPAALWALREVLEAEGLHPPFPWRGDTARSFVASIGFPPEFASSAQATREPEEFVSGPIELPPLHDFQREVLDGLRSLLASGAGRQRAVISLPTGGGKTRVTVEAAVRLVLAPDAGNRVVIWIAQTDELCEQAVQAFRQVWINLGTARMDLRVVRLWGGNPNPTAQAAGKPVVVVASIQTLNNRFSAAELEWLRKPSLVVVDECHHAITPSYSALLRWLDVESSRKESPDTYEPPIVGLSATPFRTDDEESGRLARRFDNCWLPPDQEQLYARLRQQSVLAEACYEALDSGVGLTPEELAKLERLGDRWEGLDFENLLESINQRLAGDDHRNQRLLECIKDSGASSILFFTNSVAHAEEMAARLNLAHISAAAISGSTPRVTRRYFLDRFQRGDVGVLCNHSVLTTGFDAPKTDMILIARHVFSPVRYMQMVGRGLRGEKNGGTATCRIITVLDNLGRFQDRHPYHYCRQYFSAMERSRTR